MPLAFTFEEIFIRKGKDEEIGYILSTLVNDINVHTCVIEIQSKQSHLDGQ